MRDLVVAMDLIPVLVLAINNLFLFSRRCVFFIGSWRCDLGFFSLTNHELHVGFFLFLSVDSEGLVLEGGDGCEKGIHACRPRHSYVIHAYRKDILYRDQ